MAADHQAEHDSRGKQSDREGGLNRLVRPYPLWLKLVRIVFQHLDKPLPLVLESIVQQNPDAEPVADCIFFYDSSGD
jgi:hypothetical protein